MNPVKTLLFIILIASLSAVFGQVKQNEGAVISNMKKVSVAPLNTFKLPYSVEIFSTGELDQDNKTNVTGKIIRGSVSGIKGMGGAASTASYARLKITITQPESGDSGSTMTDENGNFTVTVIKDSLHIISVNGVEYGQVRVKTKHDTVKNSVGNIR